MSNVSNVEEESMKRSNMDGREGAPQFEQATCRRAGALLGVAFSRLRRRLNRGAGANATQVFAGSFKLL
jgi:hypothetical protein